MKNNSQAIGEANRKLVAHPGLHTIDDLLKHVHPAPDDETERFVAAIYADRRAAAAASPRG
jgi:hypothetical protein